jgi:prephenate dehydrogenase
MNNLLLMRSSSQVHGSARNRLESNTMDMNSNGPKEMLSTLSVAIVGLGLMGGSLAMALKGHVAKIVGIDRDPASLKLASESQLVNEAFNDLESGIKEAHLVILAVPARSIVTLINALPAHRPDGCMLLDIGSTKGEINLAMSQLPAQFEAMGGHPMCGREQSGLASATVGLFGGETFILCRNVRTTSRIEEVALQVVARIGSQPLFLPSGEHDRLVAASSHLPYVVSSILMNRAWAMAQQDERLWRVSASGLRDTTRLSGSSPEMMLEIMMTNRRSLLEQIEAYQQEMAILSDLLQRQDWESLKSLLRTVHHHREEYLRAKNGK